MATLVSKVQTCPYRNPDERRSAAVAQMANGSRTANETRTGYFEARSVLRDPAARQAGFKAELIERFSRHALPPILYLTGADHRRQRAATARFDAGSWMGAAGARACHSRRHVSAACGDSWT